MNVGKTKIYRKLCVTIKEPLTLVTVWDECFLLKHIEFYGIRGYLNDVIMSSFPCRFPGPSLSEQASMQCFHQDNALIK